MNEIINVNSEITDASTLTYQVGLMNNKLKEVTEDQAAKIMHALSSPNMPKFIQIGDEMFATHQITDVSKRSTYLDSTVDSTVHSTYKQEVINKNTKVINKKEEIGKENEDRGKAFLARWNEAHKTKYTAWKPISENLEYWLEQYTPEQILQAVKNLALDDFWKDKMTPTIFLRQKNRHGEAVDYIGQLSQKKRRAVVGL